MYGMRTAACIAERAVVRLFGVEASHLLRALLDVHAQLLAHSSENDDVDVLSLLGKQLVNLLSNLAVGDLDIVLHVAAISHEGQEAIISDIELEGDQR